MYSNNPEPSGDRFFTTSLSQTHKNTHLVPPDGGILELLGYHERGVVAFREAFLVQSRVECSEPLRAGSSKPGATLYKLTFLIPVFHKGKKWDFSPTKFVPIFKK